MRQVFTLSAILLMTLNMQNFGEPNKMLSETTSGQEVQRQRRLQAKRDIPELGKNEKLQNNGNMTCSWRRTTKNQNLTTGGAGSTSSENGANQKQRNTRLYIITSVLSDVRYATLASAPHGLSRTLSNLPSRCCGVSLSNLAALFSYFNVFNRCRRGSTKNYVSTFGSTEGASV